MDGTTTVTAAAKRMGVTTRTVYRWLEAGVLTEAGRAGNTILLRTEEVEAKARERGGAPVPATITLAEAYVRLRDAEDDEEREAVMRDMAAAICAGAEDKGPLSRSWEAACSMAATHPDDGARERWAYRARMYGDWLGYPVEETDKAVAHKAQKGSFTTYHSAVAEMEEAPSDPVYIIAKGSGAGR